nr:unnamed protein product [Callosobruchus analis]
MYEIYRSECMESNVPEENIAKRLIHSTQNFNLSFKLPYKDTCDECNKFMLAKSQSRDENIESEYQHHLEEASRRYHLKKKKTKRQLLRVTAG